MSSIPKFTAIVLAGGESSRMGEDKALLTIGNGTLLSQICHVAAEYAHKVYVVTPWIERYRDILPPNCQLVREKLIGSARSNTPLIGFVRGLQLVETEWVLLLACDLPQLSSSQVKQWSLGLATVLPTQKAFLPRSPKGWEPLCGFYRRNCLSSIENYIENGGKSFQSWLAENNVRELLLSDRSCLFNCNTPQDWRSFNSQQLTVNSQQSTVNSSVGWASRSIAIENDSSSNAHLKFTHL